MFKFLKEKLKGTISKITEQFNKEGKEEIIEEQQEEIKEKPEELVEGKEEVSKESKKIEEEKEEKVKEMIEEKEIPKEETKEEVKEQPKKEKKKGFFSKIFKHKKEEIEEIKEEEPEEKEEEKVEEKIQEEKKELEKNVKKEPEKIEKEIVNEETREDKIKTEARVEKKTEEEVKEEKRGLFKVITEKVVTKKINEKQFEKLFWDLELTLLENNVAVEVIEKIKESLKESIVEKPIKRSRIEDTIRNVLHESLIDLFDIEKLDLLNKVKQKKPFVICFVGINGSGKTTTIAKIAHMLKSNGLNCVLVAGDTWRQAAIEQLELWAKKLIVPFIKHDYGSDPAAVAFDGVKMAKARNIDVVLIDTAGRMHSNTNLMDEMKKIVRVANPDLKIFIGESITGNDCIEQARKFDEAIGIDGIILSKADIDEKGGAAISVSYVVKKPILYLGTGQTLNDLIEFSPDIVIKGLGLEA